MSYDNAVSSGKKEIKVIGFLMSRTKGDFGFSSQFNQSLLVRKDGAVYVRDDYEKYRNTEELISVIRAPFEYKKMNH
jgi:hypothetical protein